MDPERVLAEEFTGTHPDEAARVLETLPAEEALEALAEFSVPLASRLLGRMAMPLSAEILARIEVERAALLLEALKAHDVAALLRPMDPDKRDGVLAALAADVAGRVRRLLRHAEGSAGALMDPSALTVPEDLSVPQARSLLRRSLSHPSYYVYVVDRDGHLTGILDLHQLMRTSSKRLVASLMRHPVPSLLSTARQAAILDHPGWREFHDLPVVDEAAKFLGVLRHETHRALEQEKPADRGYDEIVGGALAFGELCWVAWSEVIAGVATITATRPARGPGGGEVDHESKA